MSIQSINPATGELLRTFEPLSPEAIKAKIAIAEAAFRAYQEIPLEHRALCMRKLAGILEHEIEELATLLTQEVGKTLESSRAEVRKCAAGCRYYAENAVRILAEEPIPTDRNNSYVRWDPLGVILAVMPWNFPFWQVFRFLAPALMAGNVALLKHSSNVPQSAIAIEALVRRAGFPRGTFQTLLIESRQVESVLSDERVAAVTVTGSEAAGRAVAAQAGWLIKRSVLELGGSDPFIVLPSADLTRAVETAVKSRTINNGQSCIAAKRFIVHADIYETFERKFVAAMEALKVGDPMKDTTDIGPLATAKIVEDLEQQIQGATAVGARILCGGQRMVGTGNFFEPTVLVDVPRGTAVYHEEFFGPVAMLFPRRICRRSHRDRQRHPLRPRRQRLDQRPRRAEGPHRRPRVRPGLRQHHGRQRPSPALRRHQAFRIRSRAKRRRHARVPQRQDRRHSRRHRAGRDPLRTLRF